MNHNLENHISFMLSFGIIVFFNSFKNPSTCSYDVTTKKIESEFKLFQHSSCKLVGVTTLMKYPMILNLEISFIMSITFRLVFKCLTHI